MSNTLLDHIWGDAPGKRVVLYKKGGSQDRTGREKYFNDSASAYAFIQSQNAAGFDVWFSQALFGNSISKLARRHKRSECTETEHHCHDNREQHNAISVRSFWLDLDVDPADAKKYAEVTQAATELRLFIERLGLPLPTIVSSGVGLHVHWLLSERIEPAQWQPIANALKNACTRLNLKADGKRTADVSSVMRIPGTMHLKDPAQPKPVQCGAVQPAVTFAEIAAALEPYKVLDKKKATKSVFEVQYQKLPYDADKIADGCAVIREMRETRGNVPEPVWYGTLQILSHCTEGEAKAHEWSEGYEGYDADATQAKFERASEFGPTLCSKFAEVSGDQCRLCPHFGKISTPLQLGATVSEIVINDGQAVPSSDVLPATQRTDLAADNTSGTGSTSWTPEFITPPGYEVGKEGVILKDPDGGKGDRILALPLWVHSISASPDGNGREVRLDWITALGDHRHEEIKARLVPDVRELRSWLFDNGVYFHQSQLNSISEYISACMYAWEAANRPALAYQHFGWSKDGFVLGNRLLRGTDIQEIKLSDRARHSGMGQKGEGLVTAGSTEEWAKATELLDGPNHSMHRFTVLAALGSPFFSNAMMGVEGAVLSLAGGSGAGKTSAAVVGCSAYGHPKAFQNSPKSTDKSFWEVWAIAHHLPVIINEFARLKKDLLQDFIYAAANGEARKVMSRGGVMRVTRDWRLLTIVTSNDRLFDLDIKTLNPAGRMRIFEINVPRNEWDLGKQRATALHNIAKENYGMAGTALLQHVQANRVAVRDEVLKVKEAYDAIQAIPEDFRFKRWLIAAAHCAGMIGERTGLIRFDWQQACKWATETLIHQINNQETDESRGNEVWSEYTARYVGKFSHYFEKRQGKVSIGVGVGWSELTRIIGDCAGRITIHSDGARTLSVNAARYKNFSRERGFDADELAAWLKGKNARRKTVLLTEEGARSECFQIPLEDTELNDGTRD